MLWVKHRSDPVPQALLDDIVKTVQDRYLGLEALALASLRESADKVRARPIIADAVAVAEMPLYMQGLRCPGIVWLPIGPFGQHFLFHRCLEAFAD